MKEPKKVKNIILILGGLALIMTFLTWGNGSAGLIGKVISFVVTPVQKISSQVSAGLNRSWEGMKDVQTLEAENEQLKKEIDTLRYEKKLLEQEKNELDRLRELYQLDKRHADYPKTGARVIGKNPGNWYETFIIDKGAKHGMKVDMVVTAGGGLVGKIIQVRELDSTVISLIDELSGISSKILRTSDLCTVSGSKKLAQEGLALIEQIAEDTHLIIGDEIITSHLGKIYPPGILIGKVKDININPNKLSKTAILEPAVDFKHLEEVLVIIGDTTAVETPAEPATEASDASASK
ncbi:rod shape-determining protein MreC [Clostridiales bacterium COT073_COT-073]|nr:rod shape-determining protein MreC [Clostridiales bacterium COT073_COT-073]